MPVLMRRWQACDIDRDNIVIHITIFHFNRSLCELTNIVRMMTKYFTLYSFMKCVLGKNV